MTNLVKAIELIKEEYGWYYDLKFEKKEINSQVQIIEELIDLKNEFGLTWNSDYIEEAAKYIITYRDETGEDYEVTEWFMDTRSNFPEEIY